MGCVGTPPSIKIEFDYHYGVNGGKGGGITFYEDGTIPCPPAASYAFASLPGIAFGNSFGFVVSGSATTFNDPTGQVKTASGFGITDRVTLYLLQGKLIVAKVTKSTTDLSRVACSVYSKDFSALLKQTTNPANPRCSRMMGDSYAGQDQYCIHAKNIMFYQL